MKHLLAILALIGAFLFCIFFMVPDAIPSNSNDPLEGGLKVTENYVPILSRQYEFTGAIAEIEIEGTYEIQETPTGATIFLAYALNEPRTKHVHYSVIIPKHPAAIRRSK